jgi:hypothetical protein
MGGRMSLTPREQLAAELFRDVLGKVEITRYDTQADIKGRTEAMARGSIWVAGLFFDVLEEQKAKQSEKEG